MKQTKFLISLALSAIVCIVALAACSADKKTKAEQTAQVAEAQTTDKQENGSAQAQNSGGSDSSTLAAESAGMPTVIDFYATWCGPCKAIAPLFEMLKGEYSSKIKFVSVDVDQDIAMAGKYKIEAMPTFVFLDAEGNEIDRIVGADQQKLAEMVDRLANK